MKEKTHHSMAHQQPPSLSHISPACKSEDLNDITSESQPQDIVQASVCDNKEEMAMPEVVSDCGEESGREKLKRHRVEVAGSVWIPEIWGQEDLLKDWIDCSAAFDATLVSSRIITARAALVQEGTRSNAEGFRIENRC